MAYNKKEPVVMNLWQKMTFVCGKYNAEGKRCEAHMKESMIGRVPALECPECHNYVSFYDVEKFASFISKTSVEAAKDGEDINFKNCRHHVLNKYTKESVYFDVLDDNKGKLIVAVEKDAH